MSSDTTMPIFRELLRPHVSAGILVMSTQMLVGAIVGIPTILIVSAFMLAWEKSGKPWPQVLA